MLKTWFLNQLTQISAWIGVLIIIGAFLFPRDWIVILGALLIVTDDVWLKKFFDRISAQIKEWAK